MTVLRAALTLLAWFALAAPALAEGTMHGDLSIEAAWARATPGAAKTGAVYLSIANHGAEVDRLVGAETPVAAKAALHGHMMDGDVMKMRPVAAIEVAPGAPVVLAPGGLHLMLMGLTRALVEGETFAVTLTFERAGPVEVPVAVQKLGAMGPMPGHGQAPMN